jgi:diaminohydroxyphosphoribosylaminopyrimidine deaminase/5-amino-6-(5-phosphoribosylamino)uracil reductase
VDGVVVGIGTVLKDDPQLTARIQKGRDPYRIILDSRLRIPKGARVIGDSSPKTIIATTEFAARDKIESLEKKGVRILVLDSKGGRVDLKDCLSKLGELGLMSLLVEGGSEVNGSFLDEGLIDKILLFLSPRFIGDREASGIFGGSGKATLKEAVSLNELRVRRIGEDILIEGYVKKSIRLRRVPQVLPLGKGAKELRRDGTRDPLADVSP